MLTPTACSILASHRLEFVGGLVSFHDDVPDAVLTASYMHQLAEWTGGAPGFVTWEYAGSDVSFYTSVSSSFAFGHTAPLCVT